MIRLIFFLFYRLFLITFNITLIFLIDENVIRDIIYINVRNYSNI